MTDVLVIGAGPSGLAAAAALAAAGVDVRVVDRDEAPGGVPRHSDHPGYGARDLRRLLSGPAYARTLTERASSAGARIDVRTTVTDLRPLPDGGGEVDITSPSGRETVVAGTIVLATGCRERPRSARLVPGARPAGVMTTGWLQRLVHLEHGSPGRRAVVVGAEHVSYSAVVTLAEAECKTVAMVTDDASHTSFTAFDLAARARYRFPLLTQTRIEAIHGNGQVTGVTIEHADGRRGHIACDTVVFTGDWVPESDIAVRGGIAMNGRTRGPSVDTGFRTSARGVFAVGNLLHPASTADVCAQDGQRAMPAIDAWLHAHSWPTPTAAICVEAPLLWSAPDRLAPGDAVALRLQTALAVDRPRLVAIQGERTLWQGRLPWIRPTRPFAIPAAALAAAHDDESITIRLG